MGFRKSKPPPPPEYGQVDSEDWPDDDSVPPPPPPPPSGDTFEDHDRRETEMDPLSNSPEMQEKAPVKKWRLLKKEAEHVLIPQDDHLDDDELEGGGGTAPNGQVPMQGHFRGIQNAQVDDEEEAGMDEIEVPCSSVVLRLNQQERSRRSASFKKYAIGLVVAVCALVAITVGSVVGTRNRDNDLAASTAQDTNGDGSGSGTREPPNESNWAPSTPAGQFIADSDAFPPSTTQNLGNPNSATARALKWMEEDPANDAYNFGDENAFDDPKTRKIFEQRFTAATLASSLQESDDQPWRLSDGWMTEKDVCEWQGVQCDNTRRSLQDNENENDEETTAVAPGITSIMLNGNNLRGKLPAELALLTDLTTLALVGNWISGTIPPELYTLTNLEALDMYDNVLTGNISPDIAQLTLMSGLYLGKNKLSGPIPTEMGTMENLQELWLDTNQLTGEVPASLANCENLRDLRLDHNQLFGPIPSAYGTASSLTILKLGDNELTGGIPSTFANSDLVTFSLENNIALFADLEEDEGGAASIPDVVYGMAALEVLELSNCSLNGPLPQLDLEVDFVNVRVLDLSDNLFTGALPASYGGLDQLIVLDMSNNNFDGKLPTSFKNMESLSSMDLSKNILEGPIPVEWGEGLADLESLSLSANYLTGQIPTQLRSWQNIRVLKLDNNIFTGQLPFWIGRKKTLEEIHFEWNNYNGNLGFSGEIPSNFENLEALRILYLQGNSFSGAVPNLPANAVEIRLNDNNLNGGIPESVSQMEFLESFDFTNNDIQTVPDIICELTAGNLEILLGGCDVSCTCCTDQC